MGKGSILYDAVSQRYLINLAIMAKYDSTALGHKLRWRRSFEFASSILFNATYGQLQFGELYFVDAGTPTSDEDILLENLSGSSLTTVLGPEPFCGQISLMLHVLNEPLVTIHEIGHYVATLGDEYWGSLRVCQNDPSTHQCIMEFSRDYGLQLNACGEVAVEQPPHVVNQFCHCAHPHVPLPLPTENGQEYKHRQSCWETLQKLYPKLILPTGTPVASTVQPIKWSELSSISRYAIAIPVNPTFASAPVEQAIKNAVMEWVNRIAATDDQLALFLGSLGIIHPLQNILPDDVKQLHNRIDATSLGKGEARPDDFQKSIDQFDGNMTAYQRLFVLTAGNTRDIAIELPKILAEKRVTLVATTVGGGAVVDQYDALQKSSKWITQQNFPIADSELPKYAFSLQNELIESYFDNAPGSGLVALRWGSLPATQQAATAMNPGEIKGIQDAESLHLQLEAEGFDFPVWVEQDASSLSFLLSEPEESHIDLSLIAPDGKALSVPTRTNLPLHAFDQKHDVSGRWLVRLRRTKLGPSLPFYFIAAVNNRELRISPHIKIGPERNVQFRLQAIHTFPIDYVDAVVDIHRLQPDEDNLGQILRSVPLRRERALDPSSQRMIEVSSGIYRGEIQLEPGSFVAIFHAHNFGQATYASDPDGVVGGNKVSYAQKPIPAFTRVVKQRFQVK